MPAMHAALPLPCLFDKLWKNIWKSTEMIPPLCRCRGRKRGEPQASIAQ